MVSSHTVVLTGLAPSTTYHYQVQSQAAQGGLASSADLSFTTLYPTTYSVGIAAAVAVAFGCLRSQRRNQRFHRHARHCPSGFTGKVVSNGGSVNFAAAQTGNGVYFQNCCSNSNNAYCKFTGATVGNIFNVNQGQITFYLSRATVLRSGRPVRQLRDNAFDVVDGNDQHLFNFLTQVTGGYLFFNYGIAGSLQYASVPQGNEDTQFGNGVTLKVKMTWDGSVTNLYFNDTLVKSAPYTIPAASWTAGSVFDLGANEYQTYGGFNTLDDVIDEFTVTGTAAIGRTPRRQWFQ